MWGIFSYSKMYLSFSSFLAKKGVEFIIPFVHFRTISNWILNLRRKIFFSRIVDELSKKLEHISFDKSLVINGELRELSKFVQKAKINEKYFNFN